MIELYDNNNQKKQYEVLFTFNHENKSFIVYKDEEDDILASYYKKENDKIFIAPITDDKDYDIVDKNIEKWWLSDE